MKHRRTNLCIAVPVLLAGIVCPMALAQEQCGVAQDLVVQALENLKAGSQTSDVEDGIQLLKHAAQTCPTLGDAWYYRSLFEEKLGHKQPASFAMSQAKLLGSEAMNNGLNPFHLAAPPEERIAVAGVRQKWALVVGIGKFQNKIPALNYTRKDAENLADLLKDPQVGRFNPNNVQVLTNNEATLANIKAGLNKIARQAGPSDLVLVFVATHGTVRTQDTVGHLNYVLTNDTDPSNEDKLYGSALPMIEISEIVRSRVQARRTVVLLDTCHSEGGRGNLLRAAAPSPEMMNGMKAGVGRAIIAASGEKQRSFESDTFENGIFTHYLMEALKQQGGKAPLSSVFAYIEQQVPKTVKAEHNAEQVPMMFSSDQGADIVIGAEPSTALAGSGPVMLQSAPGLIETR